MSIQRIGGLIGVVALVFSGAAFGQTQVPHTFQAGQPARAAEVNENFSALESAVDQNATTIQQIPAGPQGIQGDTGPQGIQGVQGPPGDNSPQVDVNTIAIGDNDGRIAALETALVAMQATVTSLETTVVALQTQLDGVSNNSVLDLDGILMLEPDGTALFSGVNLRVFAQGQSGMGNIIIGGGSPRNPTESPECSNGLFSDALSCQGGGFIWDVGHRTGTHNLVIGEQHNYSTTGGIVTGFRQSILNPGRSAYVIGGESNRAAGMNAVVVGGINNFAPGEDSVVVGGLLNVASGVQSTATGGNQNEASGITSFVAGGIGNDAQGHNSSVFGGNLNLATGPEGAVVVGGSSNLASGATSLVSGGSTNRAEFVSSSVTGGWRNVASGSGSTISGGSDRTATGDADWVAGSLFQDN